MSERLLQIPSYARIRGRLYGQLVTALEVAASEYVNTSEVAFIRFLNDNAGALAYIGQEQTRRLVEDVAKALDLEVDEGLNYWRRTQ